MLGGLVLQNFKAFGERQVIPFAPITLIFGPNSAGKSSILQSLLLLKQTMDEKVAGEGLLLRGRLVDLGSFREMVFRHDVDRSVEITPLLHPLSLDSKRHPELEALRSEAGLQSAPAGIGLRMAFDQRLDVVRPEALPAYVDLSGQVAFQVDVRSLVDLLDGDDAERSLAKVKRQGRSPLWVQGVSLDWKHELWTRLYQRFTSEHLDKFVKDMQRGSRDNHDDYSNFWFQRGLDEQLKHRLDFEEEHARFETYDEIQYEFDLETSLRASSADRLKLDRAFLRPRSLSDSQLSQAQKLRLYLSNGNPIGTWPSLEAVAGELSVAATSELDRIVYLGPAREYPERHYLFTGAFVRDVGANGRMVPEVLIRRPDLVDGVNRVLEQFQIGYRLDVRELSDPEGEGQQLYALRLIDGQTGVRVSLRDVGYGISQVLPVIVQTVLAEERTVLIEQPELHLHPRLQAGLGQMFAEAVRDRPGTQFIVETHSEHLVLRLQRLVRRGRLQPSDIAVLYVGRDEQGAGTGSWCRHLRIDDEGDFIDDWPGGFFEESYEEVFGL